MRFLLKNPSTEQQLPTREKEPLSGQQLGLLGRCPGPFYESPQVPWSVSSLSTLMVFLKKR